MLNMIIKRKDCTVGTKQENLYKQKPTHSPKQ